jgi:hypothetical protein
LDRRLGGLQSRSGRGGEEKNSQPLPKLEPPIIQTVDQRYTTELSRLLLLTLQRIKTSFTPRLKFEVMKIGDSVKQEYILR